MIGLRTIVRAVVPRKIRLVIYRLREITLKYVRKFGLTKGLVCSVKLSFWSEGVIGLPVLGTRAPVFVRLNTSDLTVFEEVFLLDHFEMSFNVDLGLIVDGGANAGYVSVYFANRYPNAHIIAVEPEPSNCEILRRNTSRYPNVTVLQAAIWPKKMALEIENGEASKMGFRMRETELQEGTVEALTIDDIIGLQNAKMIDILKLDIEGAEKELFSGQPQWLGRVRMVIIELHDLLKPGCSDAFYSAMAKHKFTEFRLYEKVVVIRQ